MGTRARTILSKRINIVTMGIIICFMRIQVSADTGNEEIFPVPENLKPNVAFWIKVYTLYNSDQIIIHDADDLTIVYEVIDINELYGDNQIISKSAWREVEKIKKDYQDILNRLATYQNINPELLSKPELFVYNLFQTKASPEVFRSAAQAIRAQQGLRDHFRKGLIRSGRYIQHIEEVFNAHGIPLEVIALPHVESSFDLRAYSKFGAAGIWQFTRSTGRRFLQISYAVDERFDPIKSTEAAAKLLRENYEELGAWPLAITAYNHGTNGMKRAMMQLGTADIGVIIDKYASRNFKFASRNFYAEFLAAVEVRKNYKIYFGELQFDEPDRYITLTLPNFVKISTLAERLGIMIDDIEQLNPSLRKSVLSSKQNLPKGFELRIPWQEKFDPSQVYANLPAAEQYQSQVSTNWYQVEQGDNLQVIAKRFNTTVTALMELNDINNPHQIYIGQILRLGPEETMITEGTAAKSSEPPGFAEPVATDRSKDLTGRAAASSGDQITVPPTPSVPMKSSAAAKAIEAAKEKVATEVVTMPADSLSSQIEKSIARILTPAYGTIYVQPEETLGHYADWLGISTQELRNLNSMTLGQDIYLGQKIKLIFREVTEKEFRRKRMEYHRGIEEDFFATYKIDSIIVHKIKSGDNIWYLCNQVYEIPYWLIQKYNPNINLERLSTGDALVIPVVARVDNDISG